MNLLLFFYILAFMNKIRNQCPKYHCDKLETNVCAKYNGKDYVINSKICSKHNTCDLRETNPTTICSADQSPNAYPGMWVPSDDLCASGIRDSRGICKGKEEGEKCEFFYDCDVDLFCNSGNICEQAKDIKQICGGGSHPPFCKSYLYCNNFVCEAYGSFDIGATVSNPRLCKTNQMNFLNQCSRGISLIGDMTRDSLDDYCEYNDSSRVPPTCTYRGDGQAMCGLGSGDTENYFKTLIEYINQKPSCSVFSEYGLCDNGKQVGNLKEAVNAYASLPNQILDLQKQYTGDVPSCIKSYQFKDIWRMVSMTDDIMLPHIYYIFEILIILITLL